MDNASTMRLCELNLNKRQSELSMIKIKMPVTVSVHAPGKRWAGTGIFRFGCAQRHHFVVTGTGFWNRITKYALCGVRFLGESNLKNGIMQVEGHMTLSDGLR